MMSHSDIIFIKDFQITLRMKSLKVMASRKLSSSCNRRPRMPTQDIGNEKPSLLMKTIWENWRRLTINPPPPITTM
jgi:hypothetical protein